MGEPQWKRGATRRNFLHKSQLADFLIWAQDNGYILHPRHENAVYEVARLEKYDPTGNNSHVVIYRRENRDHLTVPQDGLALVIEWRRSLLKAVKAA